jgi:hypothetical protein
MLITRKGEGRWLVERRAASDPYCLIRDRELVDLIDELELAAEDVDAAIVVGDLPARKGDPVISALDAAVEYLRELREVRS